MKDDVKMKTEVKTVLTVGHSGPDAPQEIILNNPVPDVLYDHTMQLPEPGSGPAMLIGAIKFLAAKLHAEKELAQMYPEVFG